MLAPYDTNPVTLRRVTKKPLICDSRNFNGTFSLPSTTPHPFQQHSAVSAVASGVTSQGTRVAGLIDYDGFNFVWNSEPTFEEVIEIVGNVQAN